jgi:surface polysaccharide O-acyltransferase-like enzyme
MKVKKYGLKNKHLGLSMLKCILAFSVISSHCFKRNSTDNKFILKLTKSRRIHVPSFMIMSFYFTHNTLTSSDIDRKYMRFERLLIPYLGWPLFHFIINNILYYFGKENSKCTIKNLFYQIVIAQASNMPFHFWFLFDLIFINFLFLIIIINFRQLYSLGFLFLLFFAYFFQYSELNIKLYYLANRKNSIGRICELLPFAVTGFFICELNIIHKLNYYKLNTFIISLFIYNLISTFNVFTNFKGIAYYGVKLNILSLCITFIFAIITLENVKNKYLINFILIISNYNGGIFYLHQLIHHYFQNLIIDVKKGTFFSLFIIYFLSYIICFLGEMTFGKTKAKFLFS